MREEKLLSVIVPCYKTEQYIEKCLSSITEQSYRNIEVICVDDCSPDSTIDILERFAQKDNRIHIVRHTENRGLFHARLTGVSVAKGDYIAFVDSDDTVSCDWFRPLIESAEKENADMAIGNIIEVDENNWKHYSNIYRNIPKAIHCLQGKEVYRTFMAQHGGLYYWHVVWNKVYKKSFFDSCLPHFEAITDNLIMTEDIAFSCVFYSYAKKIQLVDNDCYFYYRHKEASTSTTLPQEKVLKNLNDVIRVFSFFKNVLINRGIYDEVEDDYNQFRSRYFRVWCNNVSLAGLDKNHKVIETLLSGFEQDVMAKCTEYDFHLNSLNTVWDDRYEKIKQSILNPNNKIISFDLFDTLIKRPVWVPEDIQYFVEFDARDILPDCDEHVYIKMRSYAESRCREISRTIDPECEDVTLSEIYSTMGEMYNLPDNITDVLMQKEIDTEIKFIMPRNSGLELYNLAKHCGKKVIIVSDIYLSEDTIKKILDKCGIAGYSELFVSSTYRKLKWSGNLFKVVLKNIQDKYNVKPCDVLHIGDTWQNDIIMPRSLGMSSLFLPKAVDVFTGNVGDIFNGNCTSFMKNNYSDVFDTRALAGQLPLRTMYGIIANNMFDNPYTPFQSESRFNGDPYFMGYYALGTYIMGIAKWVYDTARKNHYDRVLFIARDGYLVQKVFDHIIEKKRDSIESDYIFASRKAILPYTMDRKEKYYYSDNIVNIYSPDFTYLKFLQLFEPVTKTLTPDLKKQYIANGVMLNENIGDGIRFNKFLDVFLKLSFDGDKVKHEQAEMKKYYATITQGVCATFDVGYSGRIQKALTQLCGHPIDAMFLHDNGCVTSEVAINNGFAVHNYYEHSPLVTDILRETFISENVPSCVGFVKSKEGLRPVFDKQGKEYVENFALDMMQKAALQFCKVFVDTFCDYFDMLSMRNMEAGYIFEYFCREATDFDKYVFQNYFIEDKVYSGFDKLSLVTRWNENLNAISSSYKEQNIKPATSNGKMVSEVLANKSRLSKAIFYWFYDRDTFKQKYKAYRERRKKAKK